MEGNQSQSNTEKTQVIITHPPERPRNPMFLGLGIIFMLLIPCNLGLSLFFPPIFLQFVICMIPFGILSAVFFAAWAFRQ